MYPEKFDGLSSWPGLAKKILKLLEQSKDRLLTKLLAANIPEEERSADSAQPNGEYYFALTDVKPDKRSAK